MNIIISLKFGDSAEKTFDKSYTTIICAWLLHTIYLAYLFESQIIYLRDTI